MTEGFQNAISRIKGFHLSGLVEEAVKQTVILPLLNQVGWNRDDPSEVSPEYQTGAGSVDYALRIGESTPIFVEAKAGSADLKYFEKQIENYCHAAKSKPVLAVLTNGSHWWLYLPPLSPPIVGIKEAEIKRFLEINVTADNPVEIEEKFRKFLARKNMSSWRFISQTRSAAYQLFKEKQRATAVTKGLADAWNKFAEDSQVKADVLKYLIQEADFRPSDKQIEDFITRVEDLVKPIPARATKPISFTFRVRGKKPVIQPVKSGFNNLVMGVCLLMRECHPSTFRKTLLAMPEWFSESEETLKSPRKIQGTEPTIWLKYCTAQESRQVCKLVVTKFGYPPDSLTIEEK